MDIAFLPNVQESIMDELRTTEGMIFRDEGAKKLFLDTKYFVFDTIYTVWKNNDETEYQKYLDLCAVWNDSFSKELVERASTIKDINDRLTNVTVLYAKYLYATSHPDKGVSIKKPKLENLLKGMLFRLSTLHHIRNGTFYQMDPLRQDFVFRDLFRQTLSNDCIEISEKIIDKESSSYYEKSVIYEDVKSVIHEDVKSVVQEVLMKEVSSLELELKDDTLSVTKSTIVKDFKDCKSIEVDKKTVLESIDDKRTVLSKTQLPSLSDISTRKDPNEIYPDDSISHVMGRMATPSLAPSHVSRMTQGSQFKMPTVRRVKLDDEQI